MREFGYLFDDSDRILDARANVVSLFDGGVKNRGK
jgi:hypothetical protein